MIFPIKIRRRLLTGVNQFSTSRSPFMRVEIKMKTIIARLVPSCLFLVLMSSAYADTSTATLDKLRVYDTQNEKFVEDTAAQSNQFTCPFSIDSEGAGHFRNIDGRLYIAGIDPRPPESHFYVRKSGTQ